MGFGGAIDSSGPLKSISTFRRRLRGCRPDAEGIVADVDLAEKAIPDGGDSQDVAGLPSVIPKQTSQKRNATRE